MKAILLNPPKKRRRKHARRSKQASAWRKHLRNQAGTWIPAFKNPKRKGSRRRRKNATFDYGSGYTRRNRGRKSNQAGTWIPAFRNPYWVPRYAQNPGALVSSISRGIKPTGELSRITAPFSPTYVTRLTPFVGGALGNALLSSWLKTLKFMPAVLKSGFGGNILELASAGLVGAGVGMIAPKYAGPAFMGGVVDVLVSIFNTRLKPKLSGMGECAGCGMQGYLTTADAAAATPLNGMDGIMDETYHLPDLPADVAPYEVSSLT